MSIKSTKILELIEKEKELKTQLALYETINREYNSIGILNTKEKRDKFNALTNDITGINEKIGLLAINIKNVKDSLSDYNIKIDNLKATSDANLKNLILSVQEKNNELNKIKNVVDDFDGSNKEFSKIYVSENITYVFWFLTTLLFIFYIIRSMTVPYQSNLETFIFIVIILIAIYHIYMYFSDKLSTVNYAKKRNNFIDAINIKNIL
jgi:hypothetical protein